MVGDANAAIALLVSIVLGVVLASGAPVAAWLIFNSLAAKRSLRWRALAAKFELAEFKRSPQAIVTMVVGAASLLWLGTSVLLGFSLLAEVVSLPLFLAVALFGLRFFVRFKVERRRARFLDQLEMALRLMSSGIRVGLSLPQAMNHITTEMEDPSRTEFYRIVASTRIGTTTADALDDLAVRLPSSETQMLARVVRVQAQTGGSLSTILDHLAETIKDRRRIARKINALTAEGRMGALVLEALPIGVGAFIIATQPKMGHALMGTLIGHFVIALVIVLEGLAVWSLNKMLQVTA